jgi:hypothetical protein
MVFGPGKAFRKELIMAQAEQAKDYVTTHFDKVLYTAKAHTTGGRDGGSSRSDDGRLDVKFSIPG